MNIKRIKRHDFVFSIFFFLLLLCEGGGASIRFGLDCDGTILWFLYYKKYKKRKEEKGYIAAATDASIVVVVFLLVSCCVWISASIVLNWHWRHIRIWPREKPNVQQEECRAKIQKNNWPPLSLSSVFLLAQPKKFSHWSNRKWMRGHFLSFSFWLLDMVIQKWKFGKEKVDMT